MDTVVVDGVTTLLSSFLRSERDIDETPCIFIEKLDDLVQNYTPDALVVLWGEPAHPIRKQTHSSYGRRGIDFSTYGLNDLISELQDCLSSAAVSQYEASQAEPFDLYLALREDDHFQDPTLTVTTDQRFLWFVDDTTVVDLNDTTYDAESVENEFGVPSNKILWHLALSGVPTLGLEGIDLTPGQIKKVLDFDDPERMMFSKYRDVSPTIETKIKYFRGTFNRNCDVLTPLLPVDFESIGSDFDESVVHDYFESFGLENMVPDDLKPEGFTKYN